MLDMHVIVGPEASGTRLICRCISMYVVMICAGGSHEFILSLCACGPRRCLVRGVYIIYFAIRNEKSWFPFSPMSNVVCRHNPRSCCYRRSCCYHSSYTILLGICCSITAGQLKPRRRFNLACAVRRRSKVCPFVSPYSMWAIIWTQGGVFGSRFE